MSEPTGAPAAFVVAAAYTNAPFPSASAKSRARRALEALLRDHTDVRLHRADDGAIYVIPIEPVVCQGDHGGDITSIGGQVLHFEELPCCVPPNAWVDKED